MATIWHAARSPARRERTIGDISRSNSHSQINRQWRAYRSVEVVNQWTKPLTPLSPSDTAPIISYLETVANRAAEQSFHSKRSIKSGFMQARSRYSLVFSVIALTVFTRRPRSLSVLTITFSSQVDDDIPLVSVVGLSEHAVQRCAAA